MLGALVKRYIIVLQRIFEHCQMSILAHWWMNVNNYYGFVSLALLACCTINSTNQTMSGRRKTKAKTDKDERVCLVR